jgi:hypothetical protein
MTKAELRQKLLNDTLEFVLNGNQITEVPAKNVKVKSPCRAKETRSRPKGGDAPRFSISNTFAGV